MGRALRPPPVPSTQSRRAPCPQRTSRVVDCAQDLLTRHTLGKRRLNPPEPRTIRRGASSPRAETECRRRAFAASTGRAWGPKIKDGHG